MDIPGPEHDLGCYGLYTSNFDYEHRDSLNFTTLSNFRVKIW